MRTLLACTTAMTIAATLGGCGTKDPCIGKSGTCISAHVDGNAKNLTGARVTLPGGRTMTTQPSSGTIKLPAQFAILVSDPVPASPFTVELDGLRGGSVVASDSRPITITNGRGSVDFTLDDGVIGPGGGDGGTGGDMAVQNPPVVTPLDPLTTDELAPLSVTLTATDPLGGNVVLSASNLPGNAVFTQNGASGTLAWTPTFSDAGKYTVKITATPDDTSRTATYDLPITVNNAADPILIGGNAIMNAVPIGDWDKDGFGDLAVCTGDAAGATGKYHLQIIYGDATGLPLDAASAVGRVDTFDIAATNLGGVLYSCKGGDFDGDGHADIIFSDPGNDYWNATMPGSTPNEGKFTVFFYGGARGMAPSSIFVVGPQNFGEHMGEVYDVGDFNGDGKADIGSIWAINANTHILINGGARVNQTNIMGPNAQDEPDQGGICSSSYPTISIAMIDLNKDGLADWITADPGINLPTPAPTSCSGTALAAGGFRVIAGRATAPMLNGSDPTTSVEYYAPTSAGNGRYIWGRQAAGCDVDGDGYGDIGLLPSWSGGPTQHGDVYYGSATGLVATAKTPLGDAAANGFDVAAMQPSSIGCFGSYKGGKAALAVSAMPMVSGPGEIDLYGGRPLTKIGTIASPSPSDSQFGKSIASGHADVDGDGKEDLVVSSDQSGWVIYGR